MNLVKLKVVEMPAIYSVLAGTIKKCRRFIVAWLALFLYIMPTIYSDLAGTFVLGI